MQLTDFYDDLMPRLPGASEALVLNEAFAAARILCDEGWAWPYDSYALDIKADNPNIYLDPLPSNTRVGTIVRAWFEPAGTSRVFLKPLTVKPPLSTGQATAPTHYYMKDPGWMMLYPTNTTERLDSLYVTCTVIPLTSSCQFPETFKTHFREAIIDGACHRMMLMSSKPWTDKTTSLLHGRRFRNAVRKTRVTVQGRYAVGTQSWSFPMFA